MAYGFRICRKHKADKCGKVSKRQIEKKPFPPSHTIGSIDYLGFLYHYKVKPHLQFLYAIIRT